MSAYTLLPIITAVCWGLAQVLGKKSVQTLPVNSFNAVRELIAAVFAVALVLTLSDLSFLNAANVPYLLAAAAVAVVGSNLTLTFLYKAFQYGRVSVVVVALCSSPVFVFLYSFFFLDEGITGRLTLGSALILAAIALVTRSKRTGTDEEHRKSVIVPAAYAMASGACQSVMIVGSKFLRVHLSYYDLYAVICIVGLIGFLLLSRGKILAVFSPQHRRGTFYALVSGLIGRVIGASCMLIALGKVSSVVVAPVVNTSMFTAMFFGASILKEKVTPKHLLSAAIAFAGVVLVVTG